MSTALEAPPRRVPVAAAGSRVEATIGAVPRWWPVALACVAALALITGVSVLDASPVGIVADDAMYVELAKALASGEGYRYLNLPGAPAATHFPPGYPALLALLWKVGPAFPANLMVFKAVNAICLAVAAVATARLLRTRGLEASWSVGAGALVAVSIPLLVLGGLILSELFFLALLLPLLLALEHAVDAPVSRRRIVALGVAIGLLTLVRSHAVVLAPAFALLLLRRGRRGDAAAAFVAAALCMMPWAIWSAAHASALPEPLRGEYGSYTAWWMRGLAEMGPEMIWRTVVRTGAEILGMLVTIFAPAHSIALHLVTLAALVAVALVGVARMKDRLPVTALFLAGYLLIVLVWPFPPSRFVWGIWPLVLVPLVLAARQAVQGAGRREALRIAALSAMAWLAVGFATYEVRGARGRWWASIPRQMTPRVEAAVRWTLARTPPTAVIASDDELAVFLYTGRRAVPSYTFLASDYLEPAGPARDARALAGILDAYPVSTVLAARAATRAAALELTRADSRRLSPREAFDGGTAFTVLAP